MLAIGFTILNKMSYKEIRGSLGIGGIKQKIEEERLRWLRHINSPGLRKEGKDSNDITHI